VVTVTRDNLKVKKVRPAICIALFWVRRSRRSSHLKCALVTNRSRRPPRPPPTACTHRLGQRPDR